MQEADDFDKAEFQNALYGTQRHYAQVLRAIEHGVGFFPRWPVLIQNGRSIRWVDTLDVYSILVDSCQDKSKIEIPVVPIGPAQFYLVDDAFGNLSGQDGQQLIRLLEENESDKILLPVFGTPESPVVFEIDRDVFTDLLIAHEFERKERVEQNNRYYDIAF